MDYEQSGRTVEYHNVLTSRTSMEKMLLHSKGLRDVPVIVDGSKVEIGYKGGS